MTIEELIEGMRAEYARLEAKNRVLSKQVDRLGRENNELCDQIYELQRQLSMHREAG